MRVRALELVVAACVADSRERPPGETPPPGPAYESPLTDEATLAAVPTRVHERDVTPWWTGESGAPHEPEATPDAQPGQEPEPEPEPEPGPGPEPVAEAEAVPDHHRDLWSPRVVDEEPPPAPNDQPPKEPVRGAWEPPRR